MSLLIDERAALAGRPGLHALIVGVSAYPYLDGGKKVVADPWGMGQLTSTATSAVKMYDWLRRAAQEQRLPAQLATCRVLLSPAPGEAAAIGMAGPATLDNFSTEAKAWRADSKNRSDNVAFFYFAGHGVQRTTEDAVLCLEDFRNPDFGSLAKAVALANIHGGMAPAPEFPDIARMQFYFVDACRVRPDQLSHFESMNTTDVFDVSLAGKDDRSSPIYFASVSNAVANAVPGDQTLFSRGLVDCFNGEAGEALEEMANGDVRWGVTVNSLSQQLTTYKIDALNRLFGADQTFAPGGQFRNAPICFLAQPPPVTFSVEVLPPQACQFGRVRLSRAGESPAIDVPPPIASPLELPQVPGGIYRLEVSFEPPHPPFASRVRDYNLKPVRISGRVKVD